MGCYVSGFCQASKHWLQKALALTNHNNWDNETLQGPMGCYVSGFCQASKHWQYNAARKLHSYPRKLAILEKSGR